MLVDLLINLLINRYYVFVLLVAFNILIGFCADLCLV